LLFHLGGIYFVKTISVVCLLALAIFAMPATSVRADASSNGCKHSDGRAKGCGDPVSMPEPTSSALVATGLLAITGLAIGLGRKRLVQN
jgi:hypothetical protein